MQRRVLCWNFAMDARVTKVRPISIAILALGGEGGGVLADWLVDLAQHGGYLVQSTSIPGVAQRTGATIYYVELFPKLAAQSEGREPVLSLVPMPGDVAIVLASELMEAARAVERGFVTPERTLLVTSTHRVFAMTEKLALADGRTDAAALLSGCRDAARALVAFDMAGIAEATGSAVNAVLFGALAGSGALPFPRTAFEAAIRRGGVGVKASLAAFGAGFEAAQAGEGAARAVDEAGSDKPQASAAVQELLQAAARDYPAAVLPTVATAVERLCDYQDIAYAKDYLTRLAPLRNIERQHGDGSGRLLDETARELALGMAYEDTIRVAELKIRSSRFARVREEVKVEDGQILEIAEFFHPRTQEIADTLPAPLGRWLLRSGWARPLADRFTRKGRIVKTTSIGGFLLLYLMASLKGWRRRSLRFAAEQAALTQWRALVMETAKTNYALAIEVARARSLVKGYGDTHARGSTKFDRLMALLPQLRGQANGAERMAGLIKAALADEEGKALDEAIAAFDRHADRAVASA